ncbi:MAG TPA: rod shape-determining protein MreC [Methylotenera sp.]|nr:rod shape-determining protein MreC [Methylotenera sp.]HPH05475.1 rod shape-determining protein MreC [Methylotenera sp.]HPN01388.1 rod shape-determining protein MreC [Methylotenera sp.]
MALGVHHKLEHQPAPSLFARGPSAFARLIFFATLSFALIATDTRFHYLLGVRQFFITILHPFEIIANLPATIYHNTNEYFSTHNRLLDENTRLKQKTLELGVAIQKLNSLALENKHLRELLQANQRLPVHSIVAEVIHVGRDVFTKKIFVNRGKLHQVVAGEAVVDANGVIGQVTRVFPLSSEVTLVTDKSLAIPVQVERNGLRAIAFGLGRDNAIDLPFLPTNVDVQRGDVLTTSGIDGVYPAGLAVALVIQVDIAPNAPFARIICKPIGGTENHRQVLLVGTPPGTNTEKRSLEDAAINEPLSAKHSSMTPNSIVNQLTTPRQQDASE